MYVESHKHAYQSEGMAHGVGGQLKQGFGI